MVMEKLAKDFTEIHTAKNKLNSVIVMVIGGVMILAGILIALFTKIFSAGGVFFLMGLVAILLGYVGFKRARKNAEVQSTQKVGYDLTKLWKKKK
ncbi:hypothetical protein CMI37_26935 [Candidatus Pacearchaeota archaeon]|nr:hypothetical protein [Candidatus Pacearchaeota archaeon]|tara:strand:- start:178 stop:462 length:285 start_codon:yes stop_codon:yes gene_type:complete